MQEQNQKKWWELDDVQKDVIQRETAQIIKKHGEQQIQIKQNQQQMMREQVSPQSLMSNNEMEL